MIDGYIYARYSPGPQQTEASIEGQVRECKEYAEKNGIRIVNVYSDSKQTGRNDQRAGFQKMLRDCKSNKVKVVLVWKIDRFGRNRAEIIQNRAVLRMHGVKLLSVMEHIPDSPEGIILESVLEGMAEYYSANLAENIKRGLKENALACKSNGAGQSLGYIVDEDQHYRIEPNEAKIVRRIFEEYDSGKRIADIWRGLVADGIKTKRNKDFTQYSIARILKNRAYIGEYRYDDIVTPGGMPRIIDDELFERVQARRATFKTSRAARRSGCDADFLLTGKCFCGHCKGTVRGCSGRSKNGSKFYYYACHERIFKHKKCELKNIRKEWLEQEVVRITVEQILTDDNIEKIAKKVVELQHAELADRSMLKYYEKQLKETASAISNLLKAIEAGIVTESTKSRLLELEAQKTELEAQIAHEQIVMPALEVDQVVYFMQRFKGGKVDDPDYQRSIIDTFVNKILIYNGRLIITYNVSGDNHEVSAEIIESAAESASERCSTALSSSPPSAHAAPANAAFCRDAKGGCFCVTAEPFICSEITLL